MPVTTKTQVIQETVLLLHQRFPVQKDPLLQMAVWEAQFHFWCKDINEVSGDETLNRIAQIMRLLLVKKIPTQQIESELVTDVNNNYTRIDRFRLPSHSPKKLQQKILTSDTLVKLS